MIIRWVNLFALLSHFDLILASPAIGFAARQGKSSALLCDQQHGFPRKERPIFFPPVSVSLHVASLGHTTTLNRWSHLDPHGLTFHARVPPRQLLLPTAQMPCATERVEAICSVHAGPMCCNVIDIHDTLDTPMLPLSVNVTDGMAVCVHVHLSLVYSRICGSNNGIRPSRSRGESGLVHRYDGDDTPAIIIPKASHRHIPSRRQ